MFLAEQQNLMMAGYEGGGTVEGEAQISKLGRQEIGNAISRVSDRRRRLKPGEEVI